MSSVTVAWNWPLAVWCFLLGRWGRRMWGEYQWMQYVIGDPGHLKVFHTSDSAAVFVYVVKWSHHEIIDGPFFFLFFPSAHIPSTDYCMDKRLFTNQLSPDERAKHAYFCHKHQDEVGISDLCTPFSHKFTYKSSPCRCIVIHTIWVSLGIATLLIFILYMWCVCLVGEGRWFDCNIATHTHDQTKQKTKKYHLHKVTIVPSSGMY